MRKIFLVTLAMIVMSGLILSGCAAKEEEEVAPLAPVEEEEEEVSPPLKEEGEGLTVAEPTYGGVLKLCQIREPLYFDEVFGHQYYATTNYQTHETLLQGDWAKGPAGTGEADFRYLMMPPPNLLRGSLAESWEVTEPDTIVYHIRRGVRFHNKPPVNGRELTADDVVFTLKYIWEAPRSYQALAFPWDTHLQSITATDKWTVEVKTVPEQLGTIYEDLGNNTWILPREVIEEYGDMRDWRNSVGTGAFMLVDYVAGSSATFLRNPNYWMNDPANPDNQLPYLDGLKYIIITDTSTRMAALRTGKVDVFGDIGAVIGWEDKDSLLRTNPELQWIGFPSGAAPGIFMRVDTEPFGDIRVRRALAMAIDNQALKDEYFGGNAEILHWPIMNTPEFSDIYTPLDELPETTRELYEYHPDKARQLLADAGYPDGFKTEILTTVGTADFLSIIVAYFADIGVELELDVREYGAYTAITTRKTHKAMVFQGMTTTIPFRFVRLGSGEMWNNSMLNDPVIEEAHAAIDAPGVYFNEAKRCQIMKEVAPYILAQSYILVLPTVNQYTIWQPWVKGYHGEMQVGFMGCYQNFPKYVWLDLDMKEEMTGRR